VVGHVEEGGEDFGLAGEEFFLIGGEGFPVGDGFGFRGESGAFGDDAEFDLAGEDLLAHGVPAAVEFAFPFGDPIGGHVVRGVNGTGGIVGEERLVGSE